MNQNEVAVEVAKKEKGKVEQPIGQIKETIKCYNEVILRKAGINIAEVLRKVK